MVSLPPGTIRNYNAQLQNESPFMFTILNLTNTITNLFLGAVAIMAFVYANAISNPKSYLIKQHIYLCVFGYVILMSQAVLSLNIHTGWARALSCNNKRTAHYILQIVGSVLGLAGILRIMLEHPRKPHEVHTIHGKLGLVAMALTVLSLISGIVNLNSTRFSLKQNFLKITHSTLGCSTILFAFLSMVFAINENNINVKYFGSTNAILFVVLIIVSLILILSSPIMNVRRMLV